MKREQKKKIIIQRVISFILCLFISFSCFLLSACSVETEVDGVVKQIPFDFEQYINGFKVVYSNSLEGYDSILTKLQDNFFLNILGIEKPDENQNIYGLGYYYGSADNTAVENPSWFPDSIRMLVIKNDEGFAELISTSEEAWKWTFGQDLTGNNINDLKPHLNSELELIEEYDDWKYRLWEGDEYNKETFNSIENSYYSSVFSRIYLLPLKIVMYEILLGYDQLTKFAPATTADLVNDTKAGLVAKVVSSSNSSIVGKLIADVDEISVVEEDDLDSTQLQAYITKLQTDYLEKTKYIGFTKDNADRMIDYILDEVIGTALVAFDYENYGPSNTQYVQEINNQTKDQFKEIIRLAPGSETDAIFNQYLAKLEEGDVIYNPVGYNYLIYMGSSGTGVNTRYSFKEYYNYRNYIDRVANVVYLQTYDGNSETFEYEREITLENNNKVKVNYDYVKANGSKIVDGAFAIVRGNFSSTPATFLKDFEGEKFFEEFFENEEDQYTFKDSPKAEYQSILMMLKPDKVFDIEEGIGVNIMAYDPNLKINIIVRYYHYDANTGTGLMFDNFSTSTASFEDATQVYDPYEQRYGYQSDFETGFDPNLAPAGSRGISKSGIGTFIIPPVVDQTAIGDLSTIWNNSSHEINLGWDSTDIDAGANITEEMVNKALLASQYYKVIDSQNGYGGLTVLDERMIKSSFYEIVFDIVKSPNDPINMDYEFKVNISPAIW